MVMMLHLRQSYKVKLPVSFFAVDGIWIEDYSNSRKWTGKNPGEKTDPYVFYTDYGSVLSPVRAMQLPGSEHKRASNGHRWGQAETKDGRKYHAMLLCRG